MASRKDSKVVIDIDVDVSGTGELKKLDKDLKSAEKEVNKLGGSLGDVDKEFKKTAEDVEKSAKKISGFEKELKKSRKESDAFAKQLKRVNKGLKDTDEKFDKSVHEMDDFFNTLAKGNEGLKKTDKAFDKSTGSLKELDKGVNLTSMGFSQMAKSIAGATAPLLSIVAPIGAFAGVGAVATKVSLDWAGAVAETSKELEVLSMLGNTTTTELQQWSFAGKSVNVTTEKMADLFKDVSDKMGDFIQTNGGELKNFFENVASQVGVTAENFKHLSGPESLQLYVKTLEKANLSQSEMTFYMEAIANDSTKLLPLLKNNSAEFERMSKISINNIMSPEVIKLAKEFSQDMAVVDSIFTNLKNVSAGPLFKELNPAIDKMMDALSDPEVLSGLTNGLGEVARVMGIIASDAITFATWIGKAVVDVATTSNLEKQVELDEKRLELFQKEGELLQKINDLRSDGAEIGGKNSGKLSITLGLLDDIQGKMSNLDNQILENDNKLAGIISKVEKTPAIKTGGSGQTQADRDAISNANKESLKLAKEKLEADRLRQQELDKEIQSKLKILELDKAISDAEFEQQKAVSDVSGANAEAGFDEAKAKIKPLTSIDTKYIVEQSEMITEMEALRLEEIQEFELRRLEIIEASEDEITAVKDKHALQRETLKIKSDQSMIESERKAREEISKQDEKVLKMQEKAVLTTLGNMSNVFRAGAEGNKELATAYKITSSAQALIATYLGATKAMAEVPYPLNLAVAGSTIASGLVNVAQINAQKFQDGGVVGGSFTGGSVGPDNTTAIVRTGEMVLNSTQQRTLFEIANGRGGGGVSVNYAPVINGGGDSDALQRVLFEDRDQLISVLQDAFALSDELGAV